MWLIFISIFCSITYASWLQNALIETMSPTEREIIAECVKSGQTHFVQLQWDTLTSLSRLKGGYKELEQEAIVFRASWNKKFPDVPLLFDTNARLRVCWKVVEHVCPMHAHWNETVINFHYL